SMAATSTLRRARGRLHTRESVRACGLCRAFQSQLGLPAHAVKTPQGLGLSAMTEASQPAGQTIVLDYPVLSRPRYGDGKDPHPQLYALLDAKRGDYAVRLHQMLKWKQDVQNIRLHDADPLNPAWDNGFLPGLDALALYSFLRETNADNFIEIGSG